MTVDTKELGQITEALERLREEMTGIQRRLTALEACQASAGVPVAPVTPAAGIPAPASEPPGVSEEIVLVLTAAIAAFLGVRPHIRQIRMVGGGAWAQHGRATNQASHALAE
ncbi:MAG: hypothetical protein AB7F89_19090, partial [Pirellulaceae bacterium]